MSDRQPTQLPTETTAQSIVSEVPEEDTKKTVGKPRKWLVMVLSLLVLSAVGVYGFYVYGKAKKEEAVGQADDLFTNTLSTEKQSEPARILEPVQTSSTHYFLEIRLKDLNNPPPAESYEDKYFLLIENLQDIFNLSIDKPVHEVLKLVFDTRLGTPFFGESQKYNFDYYLILLDDRLSVPMSYEDEYITIGVTPINVSLEPFLGDPEYCEQDDDCTVRENFCSYGSYNYYHAYADVWGCALVNDKTGYAYGGIFEDEEMGCLTDVRFGKPKCVQNKCADQNREIVCAD